MNLLDRLSLTLKAFTNAEQFQRITDNPYYYTFSVNGGFNFDSFNQQKVIDKGYAGNADLYSIIRKVATTAANIPLELMEEIDGELVPVTDGELYDLIKQPNRLQTMPEMLEESLTYLLLTGNGYLTGYRALGMGDQIREINVLPSNYVSIETGDMADPIKAYWYQELYNIKFEREDVMHVKYPNPKAEGFDRLYGLSPLQAGNNTLQSSNNNQKARAHFAETTGVNGIISSGSERSLQKEQAEAMQDVWDEKVKNMSKYGRNIVTSANINYTPLGIDPQRLQLIESGIIDMRTLCNLYSVPSQLFNDSSGTTFNNMAAAKKSLYTESVLPNMGLWLTNFNNWFISSWSKSEGKNYCVELDISGIEVLQEDKKVEAEKDKIRMEGINTILNMNISQEAKSLLLVQEYGYSEEEAALITTNEIINEND